MNSSIRLDAAKVLTMAATLLCVGGIASYAKSESSLKPFALNIALVAGTIAATNHLASKWHESIANEQLKSISGILNEKIAELTNNNSGIKTKYNQQSIALDEAKADKEKLSQELENKNAALGILQQRVYQIQQDYKVKTEELDFKLQQDDTRFGEVIKSFKGILLKDLSERIYRAYNNLNDSVISKLSATNEDGSKLYQNIEIQLQKFQASLQGSYDHHSGMLEELNELSGEDVFNQALVIYSQITDEIASLRVKYRNILNIDERRALDDAYMTLSDYSKKFTPISKAKSLLDEYSNYAKNQLHGLHGKIDENANSLEEMREQLADLLNQLDREHLKISQLNQEIAKLKEPIIWKIAPNQATKAGNTIIVWCKSKGIHLDRSHYTGDKYEADLFFFTDRLNAAQTVDVKALNEEGENLAQLTHCIEPIKFSYDYESRLVVAHIVMLRREKATKSVKDFLQPADKLIQFVRDSYHVGLWGSTGQGKTTAISNIIGGMIQELGGAPAMRTTIPKMDEDTRNIFPAVNWLGVQNSIFGLLEAALEIQYRIHSNEQAYLTNKPFPEFDPILFFIDEINLVFTRWRKVSDADLDDVLGRFAETLLGERLFYFSQYMRIELENYKTEFAKKLLLFIWQTGRSLKVKSLIAGQNLQPGAFGIMKTDLDNCSYIALGNSAKNCTKYKVNEFEVDKINQQYELIQKELPTQPELKFTGLYCSSQGNSFFGILPPPNYYKWNKEILCPQKLDATLYSYQKIKDESHTAQELNSLDNNLDILDVSLDAMSNDVQTCPISESFSDKQLDAFGQLSKLPKKFQKLSYQGLVQLWADLPKKADGSVHKTQAYETVFEVKRSEDRKVVSDFIDYLEQEFK